MKYLLWNFERKMWWRDDSLGYTTSLLDAGRYTLEDAIMICNGANVAAGHRPEEAMVPDYLNQFVKRPMPWPAPPEPSWAPE